MIEITRQSAIELLEEIVADHGKGHLYKSEVTADYVNPSVVCYYVHNGPTASVDGSSDVRPGCIIGHFLNRLGVPLETLSGFEGKSADFVLDILTRKGVLTREDGVAGMLRHVQRVQDNDGYWGDALAAGKLYKREFGGIE